MVGVHVMLLASPPTHRASAHAASLEQWHENLQGDVAAIVVRGILAHTPALHDQHGAEGRHAVAHKLVALKGQVVVNLQGGGVEGGGAGVRYDPQTDATLESRRKPIVATSPARPAPWTAPASCCLLPGCCPAEPRCNCTCHKLMRVVRLVSGRTSGAWRQMLATATTAYLLARSLSTAASTRSGLAWTQLVASTNGTCKHSKKK